MPDTDTDSARRRADQVLQGHRRPRADSRARTAANEGTLITTRPPPTIEQVHPSPAENEGTHKESTQSLTWSKRDEEHGLSPSGVSNPSPTDQLLTPTSPSTTSLGEFSAASFVRDRVRDRLIQRGYQLSSDVRAGLALDDGFPPSMTDDFLSKARKTISRLISLSPTRDEFIRYFHLFRTYVLPSNPVVENVDTLEASLCRVLDKTYWEEHNQSLLTRDGLRRCAIELGSLLACLTLGAQCASGDKLRTRVENAEELMQRTMSALGLAEWLLSPSQATIEALLLMGVAMQNFGRSDAAWSLIGSIQRIAQSIELHVDCGGRDSNTCSTSHLFLWKAIIWQDCMLSLRYDRPPALTDIEDCPDYSSVNQSLVSCLHLQSIIGLSRLRKSDAERLNAVSTFRKIQQVDRIVSNAVPHLQSRDKCSNLQQHLEHLVFKMHTSYFLTEMCCPFFRDDHPLQHEEQLRMIKQRGRQTLVDTLSAFLALAEISPLTQCSWSLIHQALSSACILALFRTTYRVATRKALLLRFVDHLKAEIESNCAEYTGCELPWPYGTFDRAKRLLVAVITEHESGVIGGPPTGQDLPEATVNSDSQSSVPALAQHSEAPCTTDTIDDNLFGSPMAEMWDFVSGSVLEFPLFAPFEQFHSSNMGLSDIQGSS
ncbi:hypothetical protein B7463_g561, partial [Scytalidium lignicola]